MRVKEFIIRTGLFVPITALTMVVLIMAVGMLTSVLGARSVLATHTYCNVCMGSITLALAAIIIYQFTACCKKK
jgi:hypothetical protein